MRAKKTRAFELFDQGKRPSDIYGQVKVKKRTLYAYYQEWKKGKAKEREEEEKQRRQEEVKAKLAREAVEKQRKRAAIAKGLQEKLEKERQRRHNLELHFQGLQFEIRDLEWELWKARSKPNNLDEVQRISALYSQAYQRFRWVVPQLYPKETNPDRLLHHVTEEDFNRSVFATKKAVATKTGTTGRGKRDYILDANDLPLYVGEGVGDMDYEDAVKLSAIRRVALARGGVQAGSPRQPATPGSMVDDVIKIFNAFKETTGAERKGKSYIVKSGEEGYIVEEVEPGKPTVITLPGQGSGIPSSSWLVDNEGNVTEMTPGKPVVIKQASAPPTTSPKTLIVKQTPEGIVAEEHDLSRPIIINAAPPSPSSTLSPMTPFSVFGGDGKPVYDSEGKPVYANLEPMMKRLGFQSEQKRDEECHSDGIAAIKAAAEEVKGRLKLPASGQLRRATKRGE